MNSLDHVKALFSENIERIEPAEIVERLIEKGHSAKDARGLMTEAISTNVLDFSGGSLVRGKRF